MLKNLKKRSEGFTIIEVLIVLAIAGLIMLIVFLAVPALRRNSTNNQRNSDASRIAASITECLANRNGVKASCDTAAELFPGNLSQLSVPAGPFTDNAGTNLGTGSETAVVIGFQRECTTPGDDDQAGGLRDFAVMFQLDSGGGTINRCVAS